MLRPGYLADIVLVDGDPLKDLAVLTDPAKVQLVMKDGVIHKDCATPVPARGCSPSARCRSAAARGGCEGSVGSGRALSHLSWAEIMNLSISKTLSRSRVAVASALAMVCAWGAQNAHAQSAVPAPRPNIVVILADDLGWSDIAPFGGEIHTPNLEALAATGRKMLNFYVSPACSPTRAMLLSGTDNHLAGLGMMAELPSTLQKGKPGYEGVLSPSIVTFPDLLQQAGYRTVMAGKWHLGMSEAQSPAARGFNRSFAMLHGGAAFFDQTANGPSADGKSTTKAMYREDGKLVSLPPAPDFYLTDFLTSKLMDFIAEGRSTGSARKPFFAYAAYTAPHFPLQAPDALIESTPVSTTEATRLSASIASSAWSSSA